MSSRVEWLRDTSPADWIRDAIHPFALDVGSVVPDGFDAYVRIFHPVPRADGSFERWSEIAHRNGRVAHPEMQFHMINRAPGTQTAWRSFHDDELEVGSLPLFERTLLVKVLRTATSTPDRCWYCLWDGYGDLDDAGVRVRVRLPQRSYVLANASIDRALHPFVPGRDQSANIWWPEDRAWVVASEIDFAWTYVGASAEVAAALVADARLEALGALITDRFTYDSDDVNAALDDDS